MESSSSSWLDTAIRVLFALLLLAFLGLLVFSLFSAANPTQQALRLQSTIQVQGEATVQAEPNKATLRITASAKGETSQQAISNATPLFESLGDWLSSTVGKKGSVETQSFSVSEIYQPPPRQNNNNGQHNKEEWEAQQTFLVILHGSKDLEKRVNQIASGATFVSSSAASANVEISSLQFEVSGDSARKEAQKKAFEVAKGRAEQIAKQAGVELRALQYVKDTSSASFGSVRSFASAIQSETTAGIIVPEKQNVSHSLEVSYFVA